MQNSKLVVHGDRNVTKEPSIGDNLSFHISTRDRYKVDVDQMSAHGP